MGRLKGQRDEHSVKRRIKQIMISAFLETVEKGYKGTTIKDIANRAGISAGLLFYYFKTKEEIFIQTLNWVNEKISRRLRRKLSSIDDPIEKLKIRISDSFLSIKENRRFYLFYLDFLREGTRNKKFEKPNMEFNRFAISKSHDILKEGIDKGVFRKDLNVDDVSSTIKAIIDGLLLQWLFDKPESFEIYKKRAINSILTLVIEDDSILEQNLIK